MARNKKNEFGSRLGPVALTLALFALFVPLGIGYVWFKDQNDVLGEQVQKQEDALKALVKENREMSRQLADRCLPEALDGQVKKMNLGLGPPLQSQIVRLTESQAAPPAAPPGAAPDLRRAQGVSTERNY
jgi:hypothetical protein